KWKVAILYLMLLELASSACDGRVLDRCTLAWEMDVLKVPRSELPFWLYLAEDSSNFQTDLTSEPDLGGNRRWGLFQMDDKTWCQSENHKSENLCKTDCKNLLGYDIKAAVICAQNAKFVMGWLPWPGHRHYLFSNPQSIESCFKKQAVSTM
ncbi:hypothetical protein KR222_007013, partial [Zaprionus bogoriensis]